MNSAETYQRIRDYALGKQDIKAYGKFVAFDKRKGYIKINWAKPQIKKTVSKFFRKYYQIGKNYSTVLRLKNIKTK